MATMKSSRNLRKEAKADAETTGVIAGIGAKVQVLEEKDGMTKVKLLATAGTPEGWVSSDAVDKAGEIPVEPIDKIAFAKECWRQALYTGANAHYLAAVAEVRSKTKTGKVDGKTGPFNFTDAEWDANRKNPGTTDPGLAFEFEVGDIDSWRMQCAVFALMAANKTDELTKAAGDKRPSAVDLLIAQSGLPAATDARDELIKVLKAALDATRTAMIEAGADLLVDAISSVTPTNDASAKINFGKVPAGREEIAKLIVSRFRDAGYGPLQQIAAVANAIAESRLNPNAEVNNALEHSVGLFQLNMTAGLGKGHQASDLKVPANNIDIILNEVKKHDAFKQAASLRGAVDVFVRQVERPANPGKQVEARLIIAQGLQNAQALLA